MNQSRGRGAGLGGHVAGIEQRGENVRVLQPRGDTNLAEESVAGEAGAELGAQHLEGDRPVVPQVVRPVDERHAAPTQLAVEAGTAGQVGGEAPRDVPEVGEGKLR